MISGKRDFVHGALVNFSVIFSVASMGGHGALVCFLRNPGMYKAVSAFAPICNPIGCPWGQKAFSGYLGDNKETWKQYDACELVKQYKGPAFEILADQVLCESSLNHSCVLYCEL